MIKLTKNRSWDDGLHGGAVGIFQRNYSDEKEKFVINITSRLIAVVLKSGTVNREASVYDVALPLIVKPAIKIPLPLFLRPPSQRTLRNFGENSWDDDPKDREGIVYRFMSYLGISGVADKSSRSKSSL